MSAPKIQQKCTIQLKPPDDPEGFKPSLQIMASEYATRYLEQLGVSPSRFTMDLVHRHVPLTNSCIVTTFRAKGHVNDEIQVTVPPVAHQPRIPQVIGAQAILQLGLANAEAGVVSPRDEDQEASTSATSGLGSGRRGSRGSRGTSSQPLLQEPKQVPGSQFKHMAAQYLHPFKLDTNLARQQLAMLQRPMTERHGHSIYGGVGNASMGFSMGRGRRGGPDLRPGAHLNKGAGWDDDVLRQELTEEMLQDLQVTPEVVLTLLAQLEQALVEWHRHQAPETLKGRLTQEEFQEALELLTTDETINFLITLANFCHEEYLRNSPSFPHDLEGKMHSRTLNNPRGGPSLSASSNSLQRARSLSRMQGHMSALASSTVVTASAVMQGSKMQNMELHDMGYKHWMKERAAARERDKGEGNSNSSAAPTAQPSGGHSLSQSGAAPSHAPSRITSGGRGHPHTQQQQPQQQPPQSANSVGHASQCARSSGSAHTARASRMQSARSIAVDIMGKVWEGSGAAHDRTSGDSVAAGEAGPHDRGEGGITISPRGGAGAGAGPHGRASVIQFAPEVDALLKDSIHEEIPEDEDEGSHYPDTEAGSRGSTPPLPHLHTTALPGMVRLSTPEVAAHRSIQHLPSVKALAAAAGAGADKVSHLTGSDVEALQRARLFVLQKAFAALYKRERATRAGMFFSLPIFLVACRLVVHLLFSSLYPLWCQTSEGGTAMEQMDAAIVHLFDPHGYLERALSILQSTPAAVSIMSRHPHQSHEPKRRHFCDVSPLVRSAMQDAASPEARRLLLQGRRHANDRAAQQARAASARKGLHAQQAQQQPGGARAPVPQRPPPRPAAAAQAGGRKGEPDPLARSAAQGPLRTKLTKVQQEALYKDAHDLVLCSAPDPMLASLGEPAEPTTRDSWVPRQY